MIPFLFARSMFSLSISSVPGLCLLQCSTIRDTFKETTSQGYLHVSHAPFLADPGAGFDRIHSRA